MNPVEIEQAVTALAALPFERAAFPYAFLEAFGNKATTLKRLRAGATNRSDLGGVLQTGNIHIATCDAGQVAQTLDALRRSPATARAKAKFILATDGVELQAEEVNRGELRVCAYADLPDHFGFFLPLAGISTVAQIRDNAFDIRATGQLNRLYVELLKDNPDWGAAARRSDMNHFMARLIFCFFAENTDIFNGTGLFTDTVAQMSAADASDTHRVIGEIFRAMNTPTAQRENARLPRWADGFPYVNGGLFSGGRDTGDTVADNTVPRFSKTARTYLLNIGRLDWTKINPDIFGSMIQAVADDAERGQLGMHYTSVPNILKVLNPLFLDDLRTQLADAGENPRKLANLRRRMARIRVFDPACGSGNFLVIAYKEMRAIEADINARRGDAACKSAISLKNFRGIELRDFPAQIARLALIIAEYQCDVLYRGPKAARAEFLPLSKDNWILCGNALRLNWLQICPPTGTGVRLVSNDLLQTPLDQTEIDFDNEGGETYLCGNPPYLGSTWQDAGQKADLKEVFRLYPKGWKSLDYVAGWFMKAADYGTQTHAAAAFVSTNSICQGQQVPILWPLIFQTGHDIAFAHTSFKWANLASHNAGVTVVIVGISRHAEKPRRLYSPAKNNQSAVKHVANINAYLVAGENVIVDKLPRPLGAVADMNFGNKPVDGGHLLLTTDEVAALGLTPQQHTRFIRRIYGSAEFIRGLCRYALWIDDADLPEAQAIPAIAARIDAVRRMRLASSKLPTQQSAKSAHRFGEVRQSGTETAIIVPSVSSENRAYLPVGLIDRHAVVSNLAFALYDAPLWNLALIASRLHRVWIATVCGQLETRIRYSNTLGWNTFPVPFLTVQNKADLTACAESILLAREAHFPATLAELYELDHMPESLRAAHAWNDEVLERIYIGRRFRNDTERLEKLFGMYADMTARGADRTIASARERTLS